MNTEEINKLYEVVNAGECAQEQLNEYASEIYDFYVSEIERLTKTLETDYPWYNEDISPLSRIRMSFHEFHIYGSSLVLTGKEYFRGETDYESDSLPREIFGADNWKELVTKFVESKAQTIRSRLEKERLEEELQERKQYEQLKQKYEGDK